MTKVAVVQMVSSADVDENLNNVASLLAQAAEKGAELVVLPEYFPIISDDETDKLQYQEPYGAGPLQDFLATQARQHQCWLIGGTIPLKSAQPERVFNSCLLFNPQGECTARYDKIHLFDVHVDGHIETQGDESYNESATIAPGSKVTIAATPFGNIGMSVCYDLRFPELYRKMSEQNLSIISVPAAFTRSTGKRHWETLLRARAVENLCFVMAANQGGQHSARRATWGHSMIIDPWGEILGAMETGPGVVCVDIDLARTAELRASFPALKHRTM